MRLWMVFGFAVAFTAILLSALFLTIGAPLAYGAESTVYLDSPVNPKRKPADFPPALHGPYTRPVGLDGALRVDLRNEYVGKMMADRRDTPEGYAWNHDEYPLGLDAGYNTFTLPIHEYSLLPTDAPTAPIVVSRGRYILRGWTAEKPYFAATGGDDGFYLGWNTYIYSQLSDALYAKLQQKTPSSGNIVDVDGTAKNTPKLSMTDAFAGDGAELLAVVIPDGALFDLSVAVAVLGHSTYGDSARVAVNQAVYQNLTWAQVRAHTWNYTLSPGVGIMNQHQDTELQDWTATYNKTVWDAQAEVPLSYASDLAGRIANGSLDYQSPSIIGPDDVDPSASTSQTVDAVISDLPFGDLLPSWAKDFTVWMQDKVNNLVAWIGSFLWWLPAIGQIGGASS